MNLNGPIVIIENDNDEAAILTEIIKTIDSDQKVVVISDSSKALSFLSSCEKPFIILSAINLIGLNGFQLRDIILSDPKLARKCSPYIFYSAHSNPETMKQVFDRQANGYFHDINDYQMLKGKLSLIITYWKQSAV